MIPYILIRDQWNRVRIKILSDGQVEVRAAKAIPQKKVEEVLIKHAKWIENGQEKARLATAKRAADQEKPLLSLPLLGRDCPVKEGKMVGYDGQCFTLPDIHCPSYTYKPQLEALYKKLAASYLPERTKAIGKSLGLVPTSVKIGSAKTRWGSCSGKNSINFSWLLLMMPAEAVDYVIVHELCHIRHHNHSTAFWQAVEAVLPDYRARKALLEKKLNW